MESELFITPANTTTPILLIDSSGSVLGDFLNHTIFDQIKKIIKDLPEEQFRIIFWNSDNEKEIQSDNKFVNGIYKLPFVVKKPTIDQTFSFVKSSINKYCLTSPHIGFSAIPPEWINKTGQTMVYFVTDGEIGYKGAPQQALSLLKSNLAIAITRIFQNYQNVQLNIITVESKNMDFNNVETLNSAAGCDVYDVIVDKKLTKYITKFVSYTLNNLDGFVHISKNKPPVGYLPYGQKFFSELKMNSFLLFLVNTIQPISQNDDELLKIIQLLSSTICTLIKDRPPHLKKDIINTFCDLFKNTSLDLTFVKYILTDAINKENDGTAIVFASYRAQLRDLYKQATDLLLTNVKEAIGIDNSFLTLPVNNKIVSGNCRLVDLSITINNKVYPSSALAINNITLPVIPLDTSSDSSPMNEQCLRQWVRAVISKLYNVNVMEDVVIHIVLGIVLQIVTSDVSDDVKKCYRKLGHVMLGKKRANTDRTELNMLECGELPIPNTGKISDFYRFMDSVNKKLGLQLQPMSLWYILCLSLGNDLLIKNQYVHCKEFLDVDFPNINHQKLLAHVNIAKIIHVEIPFESVLDYTCLITLDNTSHTGGYKFLEHKSVIGATCCPVYVLSENGYNELLANNPVCPICYSNLSNNNFEKVGPKPETTNLKLFDETDIDVFNAPVMNNVPVRQNINPGDNKLRVKKDGVVIIMKGTVGAGKTSYSLRLKEEYEKLGFHFFVIGTDQYCKNNDDMKTAIQKNTRALFSINDIDDNERCAIVIDTCGENHNQSNDFFGVNVSGWKKVIVFPNLIKNEMKGYLSWSLRNVLNRGPCCESSNYWLNANATSVSTCVMVHSKKAKSLFGKKIPDLFFGCPPTIENALELIKFEADKYDELLRATKPIDDEIKKIMS
jgi:hypothetical protein